MKKRLADYMADFLVENGIVQQFSVTGGGAMFLNDAFGHKSGLNCTYNHHEQACAIAAEGYARATGKICSVCVTTGPGGTNALTGVVGSWLDSIPMFVISGQVKFDTCIESCKELGLRQLGDQEFNIVDCVKTMTKYAVMVTDPLSVRYHMERALYLATHGRRGPVWLDVPINVQSAVIETDELIGYDPEEDSGELPRGMSDEQLIELEAHFSASSRPVILAGEGVRMAGAVEKLRELVNKLRIPVVTAWNAQDVFDDDEYANCGRQGHMGTRGANYVFQAADFVLSVGCRMSIRQTSYNYESFAKNAYLAAIDIDERELNKPTVNNKSHCVSLKIHADALDALTAICEKLSPQAEHERWLARAKRVCDMLPVVEPRYYEKQSPVNPYIFLQRLSELLRAEDTVVASNGTACVVTLQAFKVKRGQRLFTNSGCASMGYGLPAAIGAAEGLKQSRIICLEGDGSVQMNLQELQTLVHHNYNIKLFWFNNDGYHSIRQTQTAQFNGNFCGVSAENGISFPSAEKIAAAYGIEFHRIESLNQIDKVLSSLFKKDGAAMCEVVMDKAQFFEPKLAALKNEKGEIYSPSLEDMSPPVSEAVKLEIEKILLGN